MLRASALVARSEPHGGERISSFSLCRTRIQGDKRSHPEDCVVPVDDASVDRFGDVGRILGQLVLDP